MFKICRKFVAGKIYFIVIRDDLLNLAYVKCYAFTFSRYSNHDQICYDEQDILLARYNVSVGD